MTLSKNQVKLINSLQTRKGRIKHKLFIVEGEKAVADLLISSYKVHHVFCLGTWLENNLQLQNTNECTLVDDRELKSISALSSPDSVLCLVKIPVFEKHDKIRYPIIALDDINDPGNLGTIIRTMNWFGLKTLKCSIGTVDVFNSKVVQSAKGSLFDIDVNYTSLSDFLSEVVNDGAIIYGADMAGEDYARGNYSNKAVFVFGNEANGISDEVKNHIHQMISINKSENSGNIDSLNVAASAAIIMSHVIQ